MTDELALGIVQAAAILRDNDDNTQRYASLRYKEVKHANWPQTKNRKFWCCVFPGDTRKGGSTDFKNLFRHLPNALNLLAEHGFHLSTEDLAHAVQLDQDRPSNVKKLYLLVKSNP